MRGLVSLICGLLLVAGLSFLIEARPWHHDAPIVKDDHVVLDEVKPEVKTKVVEDDSAVTSVSVRENDPSSQSQAIRAQLSPVTYTTITSELSAKIQRLNVKEGERFQKGQALVIFDCRTQEAQHQKSLALMSIAERNYVANKSLFELGSAGRVEYENSFSEYQKTKSDTEELAAVVTKCRINAPFSGRVAEQKVRPEQFVQAGQAILDILDSDSLELEFIVPSKFSSWLKVGHVFQIKIDETGRSYPAQITRVGGRIDSVSQTMKVAAVIKGSFSELSPGMSGTVSIESATKQ